ncbi:MAG: hypothetical protein E6J45_03365 [Chloroflexi bacterium]|nr:MAG: hypothetical protein E6J45_03365 [Chloroflexota bacterium]
MVVNQEGAEKTEGTLARPSGGVSFDTPKTQAPISAQIQNGVDPAIRGDPDQAIFLPGPSVGARAAAGVAVLTGRTFLLKTITLGAAILFARRLEPADFGALAVATSMVGLASFVTDIGLGASLIQRLPAPSKQELRALMTLQLAVAACCVLALYGVAPRLGAAGPLLALAAPSLVLSTVRAPALVVLERSMAFGSVAVIDIAEQVVYYSWSVAGVLLGHGVFAIASAMVVKALVGTVVAFTLSPDGRLLPGTSVKPIIGHVSYGLRFQAITAAVMSRAQGTNLTIAAVAGSSTLGYWSFVLRVFTLPVGLLDSVYRVSYPLMASVRREAEDAAVMVKTICRWVGFGSAVIAGGIAGTGTTLVPFVFGHKWDPALPAVLMFALAWMLLAPVSSAVVGALMVRGAMAVVSRAVLINAATAVTLIAVTGRSLGIGGVGLAILVGVACEAIVLDRGCRREFGFSCLAMLVPSLRMFVAIAIAGLAIAHLLPFGGILATLTTGAGVIATSAIAVRVCCAEEARIIMRGLVRRVRARGPLGWHGA